MLPTAVPPELALTIAAITSRREQITRRAHEMADLVVQTRGQIAQLLASDVEAIRAWTVSAQTIAAELGDLQVRAVQRLMVLAHDETVARTALASTTLTAAEAAWVTSLTAWSDLGFAGWVQTVVGPVRIPVTGDPLWEVLVGGLT